MKKIEQIKGYVVTLITTIVFMTAIEIIAPENAMKKYVKFVLGLMLVALLITPIIKLVTNGEQILTCMVDEYKSDFDVSSKEVSNNKNYVKKDIVSNNFDTNCENILEKQYDKYEFFCDSESEIKYTTMKFYVNKLDIRIKEKGVSKVKKVEIGKGKGGEDEKFFDEIRNFLKDKLDVEKDIINIEYV